MTKTAVILVVGILSQCIFAAAPAGKDFHDKDLTSKAFIKGSLDGADFTGAVVSKADFTGASLKGAIFKGATVANTFFNTADLTGADMRGATGDASFTGANLNAANFEGFTFRLNQPGEKANCRDAIFRNAKLSGYLPGLDFTGADFSGANLRGVKFERSILKGAIYDADTAFPEDFDPKAVGMVMAKEPAAPAVAKGKDFHDKDLTGKDFRQASLNAADFSDAVLKGADFFQASLKGAIFKGAILNSTRFGDADLTGADFSGTTGDPGFRGATLNGTNFEGVKFCLSEPGDKCKCRGANFRKTILSGTSFNCDYTGADFCGANLRGLGMVGSTSSWKKALYDDDTVFPEGFDPKEAGMVLVKVKEVEKK